MSNNSRGDKIVPCSIPDDTHDSLTRELNIDHDLLSAV